MIVPSLVSAVTPCMLKASPACSDARYCRRITVISYITVNEEVLPLFIPNSLSLMFTKYLNIFM